MLTDRPISILIVDDHAMIRLGLATMIGQDPRFRLAGEAADGGEATGLFESLRPDIVLMDLHMPNVSGVEAIKQIRLIDPLARIVILSSFDSEEDIFRGLRAGAKAYLLKDSSSERIVECLLIVASGRKVVPPEIASKLADRMESATLSRRETEILELMSTGKSNKRIARAADITEGTVKFHVNNILSKLRATGRTEAVTVALKRGMVKMNGNYS
jgi:DNA-binding NarL/FixJ family response regulator